MKSTICRLQFAALVQHETLGQAGILKVTGLPPAPKLEYRPLAVVAAGSVTSMN